MQQLSKDNEKDLALEWTRTLWKSSLWRTITWLGIPIYQWPTDLHILQELVYKLKPKFIIETGTCLGGSAIFFASLLRLLDIDGKVISVELQLSEGTKQNIRAHPLGRYVVLIQGSSTSSDTVNQVRQIVGDEKNVLVFFDSDHSYSHVLNELRVYQEFVPVGGYICAFDTICKDLAVLPGMEYMKDDNPHRAVLEFLKENGCFEIDESMNRLKVGFAPDGFLKRVKH